MGYDWRRYMPKETEYMDLFLIFSLKVDDLINIYIYQVFHREVADKREL